MKLIIVEYSKSQNAYHRCTTAERLVNELKCQERNFQSDYQPIASFQTEREADDFIVRCRMSELKAFA